MTPRRGELWWVALDPVLGSEIAKTRPCVVMTTDVVCEHRRTVVVIPLASSPSAYPPIGVPVHCQGKPAVAIVDQIRAVSKQRLQDPIERLEIHELRSVESALKQILELL